MHTEVGDRKDEIAGICQRYRVSRLEVFGSAARGADFNPETSDVDFLVEFESPTLPGILKRNKTNCAEMTAASRAIGIGKVESANKRSQISE